MATSKVGRHVTPQPNGRRAPRAQQPRRFTRKSSAPTSRYRGPATIIEWIMSVGLVGLVGLALGLNAVSAYTAPQSAPPISSMAAQQAATPEPGQASDPNSEGISRVGRDVRPPMLGKAADTNAVEVIRKTLAPTLARFPQHDQVSVALIDPSGRMIVGLNEDEPLLPASAIKVATGSALWNTFGPDYHFTTRLMARGDLSPDGVLNGDLFLVGDGDPSLMSELAIDWKVRPPRPTLSMGTIAEAIKKAGIKSITGSVVGVDNIFHGDQIAKGWKDSYISEQNATYIRALSVDRGRVIIPKNENASDERATDKAVYHTTQVGNAEPETFQTIASPDTRKDAAAALTQSLSARGVMVGGLPGAEDALPSDAKEVTAVQGPALRQLVDWMALRSDNHMADMLIRRLDVQEGGDGSFKSASNVVIDHMEQLGIDTANMVMEDGSGLSRDDRVSAMQLAQIVLHMGYTDPDWLGTLALMGETGTTTNRLKNTPAQGRWMGKTGTLDDVSTYVGAIKDRQNGVWTLAMMANKTTSASEAETLQDELLVSLAKVLVPPPSFSPSEG